MILVGLERASQFRVSFHLKLCFNQLRLLLTLFSKFVYFICIVTCRIDPVLVQALILGKAGFLCSIYLVEFRSVRFRLRGSNPF